MFKRLRERIAEEAIKFPVSQLNNSNSGKQFNETENKAASGNSTEDLITLSDSSAVVVPHTSSQQFSIGEDEDGSLSEQNTPQKKQNESFNGSASEQSFYTPGRDGPTNSASDLGYGPQYRPSKSHYIPQSDIESEREDPPTLNLESISKDQLLTIIDMLKAKAYKYKNKYAEVVKNYKELRDEKLKIENTLIEHQDKGLRRIAELREQCQLEQKAKAHLEANLRLLLEEKDSRIMVLDTQINLLKGDQSLKLNTSDSNENQTSDASSGDIQVEDNPSLAQDKSAYQEKIERIEHQFSQAKKTITAQTDQITLLRKQNEGLSQELEEKIKALNEMEDQVGNLKSQHEFILKSMQGRLEELENQQEESLMAMAETKKNMHEELELKEKQLKKAEEEAKQFQIACETEKSKVTDLQKQHEGKINELQRQLESTEKMLEEEKENLMQELGRGKSAAITLMQQECSKKIAAIEEEWKAKLQNYESEKKNAGALQAKEAEKKVINLEEKLKLSEQLVEDCNAQIQQLKKENTALKSSLEKLDSENMATRQDENLKCVKDKLENAEKNYLTQMNEMKSRMSLLEKEKYALESEKAELLKVQEKLSDLKNGESAIKTELQSKEDELRKLQQKYETSNKDQVQKIQNFQETMKDKENMIVKLKTNLATVTKENVEKNEEFKKKIKALEEEREQLMIQAQERVSTTEAKCREDIKALQEKNNKLLADTKEMEKLKNRCTQLEKDISEIRKLAESQRVTSDKEISHLKEKLVKAEENLSQSEKAKQIIEVELSGKVNKLQEENSLLLGKSNHFESLKAEKEELNEKLKQAEQQVTSVKQLEGEKDALKKENASISLELEQLRSANEQFEEKIKGLGKSEIELKNEIKKLVSAKEKLESEITALKNSFETDSNSFKLEKENLLKEIDLLKKSQSQNSENNDFKSCAEELKEDFEAAIKAKEEEMETKLKHLLRDFGIQMDIKDKDCDKIITETIEKSQITEERLMKEHRSEIASLRQSMFERECAMDEMRDHYEETLQEKEKKLKELHLTIKKLTDNAGSNVSTDSALLTAEGSDWDDTWAVPEESIETISPVHHSESCKEHVLQIESLQDELSKCNSEIKELKILLRLSPPESMVNNNNRRDSMQSIPEPTEFEYLKNIIYEYMMGKEPITLAKVIAAVLRFSDSQTQQVIRREEAKHPTR